MIGCYHRPEHARTGRHAFKRLYITLLSDGKLLYLHSINLSMFYLSRNQKAVVKSQLGKARGIFALGSEEKGAYLGALR